MRISFRVFVLMYRSTRQGLRFQPRWALRKRRNQSTPHPRPASVNAASSLLPAACLSPLRDTSPKPSAFHLVPNPLLQLLVDVPHEKHAEPQAAHSRVTFRQEAGSWERGFGLCPLSQEIPERAWQAVSPPSASGATRALPRDRDTATVRCLGCSREALHRDSPTLGHAPHRQAHAETRPHRDRPTQRQARTGTRPHGDTPHTDRPARGAHPQGHTLPRIPAHSAGCFERPLYARHCLSYSGYSKEQSGVTSLYSWSCQRDPRIPHSLAL